MPEVTRHAPGSFCWMEIGTTDTGAAKEFYAGLLGWSFTDTPSDSGYRYTLIKLRGKDIGGLYELMKEQRDQGVPPHWLSYVSVESAARTTDSIKSLGGNVLMGPMDVMDIGRMSVATDPTGATFAVWEPLTHCGAGIVGDVGAACWNELMTTSTDRAGSFYTKLFGWKGESKPMGPMMYTTFKNGEAQAGGMMQIQPEMGPIPPHWMIYISVDDCEKTVGAATSLGGRVLVPPMDVPNVGRFSTLMDPQGAAISVIKLTF